MPKNLARSQPPRQIIPEGYDAFLRQLKQRIREAQLRAALAVNRELVLLYWQIGHDILDRQNQAGWGAKVNINCRKTFAAIFRICRDSRRGISNICGLLPKPGLI